MPTPRRVAWLLLLPLVVAMAISPARGDEKTETTDSAVLLLRKSMQISRNGQHNMLLRALRQLGDPELAPLFSELAQADPPALKIHGLLGLAESSPERKLDLVRVAAMENPQAQAELIGAAMDADLVDEEQARQILNWGQIDPAVKLLAAAPLVKAKNLPNLDVLRENSNVDNIARKGMALVMLHQLGEPGAYEQLQALSKSADEKRDGTREIMLQTSLRYDYDRVGPWALEVATEPGVGARLGLVALRAAMRFKAPGANDVWQKQYESNADVTSRTRLALIALQLAPWIEDAEIFRTLMQSDDAMIKQMGIAGEAIASEKNVAESVVALVQMSHPLVNNWAIGFASKYAKPADAQAILLALVLASEGGLEKTKAQRVDDAVGAVAMLVEHDPEAGARLLKPILANEKTEDVVAQAILLGLIGAKGPSFHAVEGVTFDDPLTSNLALVLLAKHGQPLTAEQLRDLGVVVRGGGIRHDSVRIQAAWTYLKLTGQTKEALAQVLGKA